LNKRGRAQRPSYKNKNKNKKKKKKEATWEAFLGRDPKPRRWGVVRFAPPDYRGAYGETRIATR
jgi:hypothetical protein